MLNLKGHEENFEIIEKIGRGGFSSVYRVANRFDDNEYALKKIKIAIKNGENIEDELFRVMKEAKTLSKLNHPNIVRYYGSWISEKTFDTFSFCRPSENHNLFMESQTSFEDESKSGFLSPVISTFKKTIQFNNKNTLSIDDSDSEDNDKNRPNTLSPHIHSNRPREKIIFIQTQLCAFSLEDYIEERNKTLKEKLSNSKSKSDNALSLDALLTYEAFNLALQLLRAIRYIHQRHDLIHRDIKPSNIFIDIKGISKYLIWSKKGSETRRLWTC